MGWRKEQILSLTWPDISLEAGTIIRRAEFNKNKRPSVLPMVDYMQEIIERRWQARLVMTVKGTQVCDLVFHREGERIKDFRGAWEAACIKAGLYRIVSEDDGTERKDVAHFHDFRRSCVSNLENFGTPRKVAKSISGHVTDSVYERYHIVKKEHQQAALARVGAGLRGSYLHKTPLKPAQGPENQVNAAAADV